MLFVWGSTDKEVLGMKFEKSQIIIKKHGLGHTIPWMYRVSQARSNNIAFLTEQ